jgi:putative transposase
MSPTAPNPEDGARRSPSTHAAEIRKYPARLYHAAPPWVNAGSVFHIRVRCARENTLALTDSKVATALLESVRFYHERQRWFVDLFLLMPDHWHALISFPPLEQMSRVVGDWKRFQEKRLGIAWQEGFFDHRIRSDRDFELKAHYIRQNPVAKGLCVGAEDWPWVWPKMDGDLGAPSV